MFHPGGSVAYSIINPEGKKLIFATDVELKSKDFELNDKNRNFFDNADVLVLDAQYTVEEASQKENWGHSTFCFAIDFASLWNVKKSPISTAQASSTAPPATKKPPSRASSPASMPL